MAWEKTEWACGHKGATQLYGKTSGRNATVAHEASRPCMACWLVEQWEKTNDPRAQRSDRYKLAGDIAESKGKRIHDLPDSVPVSVPVKTDAVNLASVLTEDLIAELKKRGIEI